MPFPLHFISHSKEINEEITKKKKSMKTKTHKEQNPNHKDRKKHIREVAIAKELVAIEPKWKRLQAGTTGFVDDFSLDLWMGFLILVLDSLWFFG